MALATKLHNTAKRKEQSLISLVLKEKLGILTAVDMPIEHTDIQKTPEGLVHDLSSPLTALILNLEYLVERDPTNKDNKELLNALTSARHMQGMIKNFEILPTKDLFKNKMPIVTEIKSCIQMLGAKLSKSHINVSVDGNGAIYIRANNYLFDQVIINLLTNAIDSFDESKRKTKKISVAVETTSESVQIKIADNGKGMTKNQTVNAFKLFYSTKAAGKGSGLGLYICRQIIENEFGGTITLKSQENKGTQILIHLPLDDV